MQEKLNALIEKQCASIPKTVEALGIHLRSVQRDRVDALDAARALLHQLKGSSGTAGFQDICLAATALYDWLDNLARLDRAPTAADMDRSTTLYRELSGISRDVGPQSSWLYAARPTNRSEQA